MPVNGQMNLMDVVAAGQQAQQWAQQNEQYARQRKAQQSADEANQAAASVIDDSKKEWMSAGAQGNYTPSDTTMMRAAQARGMSFAERGDWENFMKNEATVTGQRMKVRANALQKYLTDGDGEALVRAHEATVFDGRKVVGIEKVEGADAVLNLPARPGGLTVKFSDGKEQFIDPAKLAQHIKASLLDPAKTAELEAEFNMKAALARVQGQEKRDEIKAKGAEDRATEDVKTDRAIKVEGVKFGHAKTLGDAVNETRINVAKTSAGASVESARIGKEGRIGAAEVAAGRPRAGEKTPAEKEVKDYADVHAAVIRSDGRDPGFGGARTGTPRTRTISQGVIDARKANPGLSVGDAIEGVKRAYDERFDENGEPLKARK